MDPFWGESGPGLLSQGTDVIWERSQCRQLALVGSQHRSQGSLDSDTLREGFKAENAADDLPKMTGVVRGLISGEIGCEETT